MVVLDFQSFFKPLLDVATDCSKGVEHEKSFFAGIAAFIGPETRSQEELWADLIKDEKRLESPAWHGEILKERGVAYSAGKLTTSDWAQAKSGTDRIVS